MISSPLVNEIKRLYNINRFKKQYPSYRQKHAAGLEERFDLEIAIHRVKEELENLPMILVGPVEIRISVFFIMKGDEGKVLPDTVKDTFFGRIATKLQGYPFTVKVIPVRRGTLFVTFIRQLDPGNEQQVNGNSTTRAGGERDRLRVSGLFRPELHGHSRRVVHPVVTRPQRRGVEGVAVSLSPHPRIQEAARCGRPLPAHERCSRG